MPKTRLPKGFVFRASLQTLLAFAIIFAQAGLTTANSTQTLNIHQGVSGSCGNTPNVSSSSANRLEQRWNSGAGGCGAGVVARAGSGGVGLMGSLAVTPGPGSAGSEVIVSVSTRVEIILEAPATYTGGLIPVSLTYHSQAQASASVLTGSPFSRAGVARIRARTEISGRIPGQPSPTLREDYFAEAFASNGTPGAIDSLVPSRTTGEIMIDPTLPLEVFFSLTGTLAHSSFNDSVVTADIDSLRSLSFALDGPALNLPPGFSANSIGGMIVDNEYVGAIVPEPGSGTLLLLGLLGLARGRHSIAKGSEALADPRGAVV